MRFKKVLEVTAMVILQKSLTALITAQEKDSALKVRVRYYGNNMVLHFKC